MSNKLQTLKEEKKFMEDQVKAQKRQNKLLIVALDKTEGQHLQLVDKNCELKVQMRETKKGLVEIPQLDISPFD